MPSISGRGLGEGLLRHEKKYLTTSRRWALRQKRTECFFSSDKSSPRVREIMDESLRYFRCRRAEWDVAYDFQFEPFEGGYFGRMISQQQDASQSQLVQDLCADT